MLMYNDDLGWNDTLLAVGELPFGVVEGDQEDEHGRIVDGFALADFIKVRPWGSSVCVACSFTGKRNC